MVSKNLSILKNKPRINDVVDGTPISAKGILSFPVSFAGSFIGPQVGKLNFSFFATHNEHMPHRADVLALQIKDGILKFGMGMIALVHGAKVSVLESCIEFFK